MRKGFTPLEVQKEVSVNVRTKAKPSSSLKGGNTKQSGKLLTGFTLTELLVALAIMIVLIAIAVPTFLSFQKESDLNNGSEEIINTLRLAQNKTMSSEGPSQWGVYFATSTTPHQYTLFKGSDHASRATSSDEIHKLPNTVEVYEVNFSQGADPSVVFERITGKVFLATTTQSISLRLKTDFSKARTIYIDSSGHIRY